jgi:hypothetical protein
VNTLHSLYQEKKTLADATHLFTPEGRVITERITDPTIQRDWMWAQRNWKDFETAVSSSINRFRRFLLNPVMRSIFGQQGASLDLGTALEEGQIILVNLATSGGHVSRQNVDLFATLLLSDLQMASDERGKRDGVKPFYCSLDEFWRFLTPTMAENLAAGRGFGIGMTLVNQFPRQILNGGPHGQRIFDEVVENCRTKICFRLRSRENLELAADQLFMQTFDPMRVKYQHRSTKVLGHDLRYMPSFGQSVTNSVGGGQQKSHTDGRGRAAGTNWSHTDSVGHSTTQSHSESDGTSESDGENSGESASVSNTRKDSDDGSETIGVSAGTSHSVITTRPTRILRLLSEFRAAP